ncbi:CRISPR-associated endonuclease Cas2 [Methanothermococcus sp.]|uniref:CRISPR-associated endonuclease Cas2 n=1 Tax=Methanothermococcus sp. TaxID=2614238 RepID=UPI0031838B8B
MSDKCLNYGLYRIQKSVFAGSLNNNRVDELRVFCENILKNGGENDKIYIIPVCKKCFGSLICVGEEFDKDLITDNKNTLVL